MAASGWCAVALAYREHYALKWAATSPHFHLVELQMVQDLSLGGQGRFGGPGQNRSLERGLEVLRAFRPGTDLLGNGELAERTGLSRATISRLTQTLVTAGFLEHDRAARAYRLAVPVLSLGHAMRASSPVLRVAVPLMHEVSARLKVNVGLASPDRADMIYLESIRYHRKVSLRTVVAGQRVPIELTSLGRAYLGRLDASERQELLVRLKRAHSAAAWRSISAGIGEALAELGHSGYCWTSWQPNVIALAAPLVIAGRPLALNFSQPSGDTPAQRARLAAGLAPRLLALRDRIENGIEARTMPP